MQRKTQDYSIEVGLILKNRKLVFQSRDVSVATATRLRMAVQGIGVPYASDRH
jgi:hypothetical protein